MDLAGVAAVDEALEVVSPGAGAALLVGGVLDGCGGAVSVGAALGGLELAVFGGPVSVLLLVADVLGRAPVPLAALTNRTMTATPRAAAAPKIHHNVVLERSVLVTVVLLVAVERPTTCSTFIRP